MNNLYADGPVIRIDFGFDREIIEIVKSIADRKFVTEPYKHWVVPATSWHADQLLTKLKGRGFSCDDGVRDLYYEHKRLSQLAPLKQATDLGLFPFQAQAVDFLQRAGGRAIVADEMGLGKTVTTLGYIRLEDMHRILVVAPANVIHKWKAECERWLDNPDVAVVETSKGKMERHDILIMSYRIMTLRMEELSEQAFDCIVFDEFHYLKSTKAQRTKAARQIIVGVPHLLCLSGTPLLNRPIEMFEGLKMIHPSQWPSKQSFGFQYCGGIQGYGKFKKVFQGISNVKELAERVRSVMIRRLKQEVADQLPELTRSMLLVDVDLKEYNKAYTARYDNPLTKLTALRKMIGEAKTATAAQWSKDFLFNSDDDTKLVIYAHHIPVVDELKTKLQSFGVVTITGEVSAKERDRRRALLQDRGGPRVCIITSAGGEGIDLFGKDGVDASNILFVEREFNPAKEEQAESRLHRMGQGNAVVAWYLVARRTIDEWFNELIEQKRILIHQVVGLGDVKLEIVDDLLDRLGVEE